METENPYTKIVSIYTNVELLESIEKPEDFDDEVYQAILMVSFNRNLISENQLNELSGNKSLVEFEKPMVEESEEEIEEEINSENYWKCPECGETVETNFDTCWSCQSARPAEIEHPGMEEIVEYQTDETVDLNADNFWKCPNCGEAIENNFDTCWSCYNPKTKEVERPSVADMLKNQPYKEPYNFFKSGLVLVGLGILLIVVSGLSPISEALSFEKIRYGRFGFGVFFMIIGMVIFVLGFSDKKSK